MKKSEIYQWEQKGSFTERFDGYLQGMRDRKNTVCVCVYPKNIKILQRSSATIFCLTLDDFWLKLTLVSLKLCSCHLLKTNKRQHGETYASLAGNNAGTGEKSFDMLDRKTSRIKIKTYV